MGCPKAKGLAAFLLLSGHRKLSYKHCTTTHVPSRATWLGLGRCALMCPAICVCVLWCACARQVLHSWGMHRAAVGGRGGPVSGRFDVYKQGGEGDVGR